MAIANHGQHSHILANRLRGYITTKYNQKNQHQQTPQLNNEHPPPQPANNPPYSQLALSSLPKETNVCATDTPLSMPLGCDDSAVQIHLIGSLEPTTEDAESLL
ncbi:hypothetical protein ElyMa_005986800 [Elysia marginata]|uniref:Uncharacterized protein n=1 Tax=Elysia marginata TaxID=1093978 RepID=A0AAV4GDS0_9GAST|nr:hypothetical protein ElyMa_005986800 [Elysia marginata]